jgi:leader peptidase (prepilin peptidase)/N-methyltransferase
MGHEPTPPSANIAFSGRVMLMLAGIVVVLITGVVGLHGFTTTALAYTFFVVIGVWLSAVDLRLRILPNRVVVPATVIGLVLVLTATVIDEAPFALGDVAGQALRVVSGGFLLFVVFLALALISPRGLGMGDVKFAGFIGIYLAFDGWRTLLTGAAAGFVLAATVGLALLVLKRTTLKASIPFGPMMFCGAVLALAL